MTQTAWSRVTNRLAIECAGTGASVAILCHGLTNDRIHCPLIQETGDLLLSLDFSVVRFDLSGSGDSPGLMREKTISAMIQDLRNVVEIFSDRRLLLWGRSLGATLALAVAHERPVDGLILVSPVIDCAGTFSKYKVSSPYSAMPDRLKSPWIRGPWELRDAFFDDLPVVDEKIGQRISTPALVIQGLQDSKVDSAEVRRRAPLILSNLTYHESGSGDHNFTGGEDWVIEKTRSWIISVLPAARSIEPSSTVVGRDVVQR